MSLRIFNTIARKVEDFRPKDPKHVTMYVCGPTVWNYAHIGNARPAVVFDTLYRLLSKLYPKVTYARNITDVDDKINQAAKDQGVPISTITTKFAQIYREDMGALGVKKPTLEPKVTDHMPQIIAMTETLIKAGHAYEAEGHVLFSVPSFKNYGQLSNRNREEMIAGARVEVAPYKKDPADFVLWKPSDADTPGWDSPWGRGRPGWHLECSAMIEANLGETIDIHGGGLDLIFPHHENEIAQGTCAHAGKLYCRYWMHNGFLNINSEKMSKSLGNVLLVHDIIKAAPGEAIRLALLSGHYRAPLDLTDDTIPNARAMLDRFYRVLENTVSVKATDTEAPKEFLEALCDDLNTPQALAVMAALARDANKTSDQKQLAKLKGQLLACGQFLGILTQTPAAWFSWTPSAGASSSGQISPEEIEKLIAERNSARAQKDFTKSDQIRKQLLDAGVVIEDGPTGTRWQRK